MSNRARALISLIAVFLLGCLVGGGGLYTWQKRVQPVGKSSPPARRGPDGPRSFAETLKLTPQQQDQFKQIFEDSRRQIDALRAEMEPKFHAVQIQTNQRILASLNEEQKKKFEQMSKEMEARRESMRRGGRWGNPMPPPNPPKQ